YNNYCIRCGSSRLYSEIDIERQSVGRYSSADVEILTIRCSICWLNPAKEKPKNFLEKIKRLFKNNKKERILKVYNWWDDKF
ncbi:MAG: hypothetical protein GXO49_02010, partial [Chlorobi bacterium]|nr:hypothetical protein [Chlorobiota bacterium]